MSLPPVTSDEPVYCQACGSWFTPNPDWLCDCGECAAFAIQPGCCQACGQVCQVLRDGHRERSLCRCLWSAEQLAALEVRQAEMAREDQAEADLLAGKRPTRASKPARPTLPDDAPLRDWWPPLLELLPTHIDRGPILDHVEAHREDYPLQVVVDALRRVLERVQRSGKTIGSPGYITAGLARELGSRAA